MMGFLPLVTDRLLDTVRNRRDQDPFPKAINGLDRSDTLFQTVKKIQTDCAACGDCKSQCALLTQYGTPKEILTDQDSNYSNLMTLSFECSLCDLCSTVCPKNLSPCHLFFLARKEAVKKEVINLSRYKRLFAYEKTGNSPLFSWYGLPQGCDTVFFPGCTMPGTHPETTWKLFSHLQKNYPALGVVLDCCNKISHDLGRQDHFNSMFVEMLNYLKEHKIKNIWVTCPSCYKIFTTYGSSFEVKTVYEILDQLDLPPAAEVRGHWAVHDPCTMRQDSGIQESVRHLLGRMGIVPEKMNHSKGRTICCGEGGSVGCLKPDLAKTWGQIRKKEADGRSIVTYCAGCTVILSRITPTIHLADLIFNTKQNLYKGTRIAKAPFTYLHRLRLKRRLKQSLTPAIQRVRRYNPDRKIKQSNNSGSAEQDLIQTLSIGPLAGL